MASPGHSRPLQTVHAGILLVPGFTALHLDLLVDGFRIANRVEGQRCFQWTLCAVSATAVTASNGKSVVPDDDLVSTTRYHAIFVVAGDRPERNCTEEMPRWVRRHARRGAVIGAVDTGAVVLARAGIGRGRRMAIHWEHEAVFRENHPEIAVSTTGVVVDGRFMTSSGGLSVAEIVLATISRFHGPILAARVGDILYFGGSDARNPASVPVSDPVRRAELLMMRNLHEPLALDEIAAKVHVHKRTLARRFEERYGASPMSWYQAMRLEHAKELLIQNRLSIKELARAAGFASTASFSTAFKNRYGAPPTKLTKGRRSYHAAEQPTS